MIISKVLPRTLRFLSTHSKAHQIIQYLFAVIWISFLSPSICMPRRSLWVAAGVCSCDNKPQLFSSGMIRCIAPPTLALSLPQTAMSSTYTKNLSLCDLKVSSTECALISDDAGIPDATTRDQVISCAIHRGHVKTMGSAAMHGRTPFKTVPAWAIAHQS